LAPSGFRVMLKTSDSTLTVPEINIKQKWVSLEAHVQRDIEAALQLSWPGACRCPRPLEPTVSSSIGGALHHARVREQRAERQV
jgi:hypothetical protein